MNRLQPNRETGSDIVMKHVADTASCTHPSPTLLAEAECGLRIDPEISPTEDNKSQQDEEQSEPDFDHYAEPLPTAAEIAEWKASGRTYEMPTYWSYRANNILVEDPEDYQPRKLHPVNLGDIFIGSKSSYKIVDKLDFHDYDASWAVWDINAGCHRGLKIESGNQLISEREELLKVYEFLSVEAKRASEMKERRPEQKPGINFLDVPYDVFNVTGPNGSHLCTVTDACTFSLRSLNRSEFVDQKPLLQEDMNPKIRLRLMFELCKAVQVLHNGGIVHGKIDPWTVRFAYGYQSVAREVAAENLGNDIWKISVRRLDGAHLCNELDATVPKELVLPNKNFARDMREWNKAPIVCLTDFSKSRFLSHNQSEAMFDTYPHTPGNITYARDIFDLGDWCTTILADEAANYKHLSRGENEKFERELSSIAIWNPNDPEAVEGYTYETWYDKTEVEILCKVLGMMGRKDSSERASIDAVVEMLPVEWGTYE
ncbi:hypothetical protein BJ508DRAFT_300301 [Ascobolus immersus RN42]|uniref:Protein kinase domain-containing protein n=1 Tax=Ascobolus immersus RN42 TaxID=1160509 RepID=A0A3N4IR72_ASCIM|nr:hypothetical protein BJ508DRAFT_300301 [Ascobolus immersus RN42]